MPGPPTHIGPDRVSGYVHREAEALFKASVSNEALQHCGPVPGASQFHSYIIRSRTLSFEIRKSRKMFFRIRTYLLSYVYSHTHHVITVVVGNCVGEAPFASLCIICFCTFVMELWLSWNYGCTLVRTVYQNFHILFRTSTQAPCLESYCPSSVVYDTWNREYNPQRRYSPPGYPIRREARNAQSPSSTAFAPDLQSQDCALSQNGSGALLQRS